jgi:uncharacterized membrane protein YukC
MEVATSPHFSRSKGPHCLLGRSWVECVAGLRDLEKTAVSVLTNNQILFTSVIQPICSHYGGQDVIAPFMQK